MWSGRKRYGHRKEHAATRYRHISETDQVSLKQITNFFGWLLLLFLTIDFPIQSDFMTLHCIILELIDAGAHVDTVNSLGKTPYEAATTGT